MALAWAVVHAWFESAVNTRAAPSDSWEREPESTRSWT